MEIHSRIISDKIFEITIIEDSTTIKTDISNLNGVIPDDIINQFKSVIDEMIEYNKNNISNERRKN